MKEFSSFTMIREPLDRVWSTMRDRLPEVAASMKDLERIEVLERSESTEGTCFVNRWIARQKVPTFLRGALGSETISWLDRASWHESRRVCQWTIEPAVLSGYIDCGGSTSYRTAMAGRGTRVNFEGYFDLKPGFAGVLPPALEPMIGGFVESVVSTMIPRNLARAVVSAGELITKGSIQ
jgi:hypothetical protein